MYLSRRTAAIVYASIVVVSIGVVAGAQNLSVEGTADIGSTLKLNATTGDLLNSTNGNTQTVRLTNDNIVGVNSIILNDTGANEGLDFGGGRNISVYETGQGGYPAFVFNTTSGYPFVFNGASVGIGTTSPGVKLHVNGSVRGNQAGALRISTGYGWVDIGPKNASWSHFNTDRARYYFDKEIRVNTGQIGSYDENLQLRTSGTTRVTIQNSNGYVGIGTTTPGAQLDVTGNTRLGRGIADSWFPYTNNWAYVSGNGIIFREGSAGSYTERMRIADDGKVGIGTSTPGYKLTVTGKIRSTSGGFVFPDGTVQTTAAVSCGPQ